MKYRMYLIIANELGFGGTKELREVIKVNPRKVNGMQNSKALKSQNGFFVFIRFSGAIKAS